MKSRFLAQHFTVNISKFQLPRKGVKSQLSISFSMSMASTIGKETGDKNARGHTNVAKLSCNVLRSVSV